MNVAQVRLGILKVFALGATLLLCSPACTPARSIRTEAIVMHGKVSRVPMDIVHFGNGSIMPVVELKMSGKTVRFLLDSGANKIFVSREFADANGISSHGRVRVKRHDRTVVADVVGLPEFEFGGATVPAQDAVVTEFVDEFTERSGYRIDGIIGMDLVDHAIVRWNYSEGWAEIRPASDPIPEVGFSYVPIHRRGSQVWVMVDVGGDGRSGLFLLDTGFSGTLTGTTNSPVAQRFSNLAEFRLVDNPKGMFRVALLPTVSVAGVSFADLPITLKVIDVGVAGPIPLLGSELFRHSELIVDFARGHFGVRKIARGERKAGRWGLFVERKRGALRITMVAAGGPAANAGFRLGDVVETLDEQLVPEKVCEFYRLLSDRDEVTLGITRGKKTLRISVARAEYVPIARFR